MKPGFFSRSVVFAAALGMLALWPRASAAQQFTGAAGNVSIKLTLPAGVAKVKGILIFTVRGLASGWAASQGFKDLAMRLESAIATVSGGDDLNDGSYPKRCASGEFNNVPMALSKIATDSMHPELANAPLVTIGHSHGGDYWNWFNACHPDRVAMVFVHASGGVNYSAAALETPVLYELGTGDLIENGSKKPRAGMFVNRSKGAPMALIIGQGEGHDQVTALSLSGVIAVIEGIFKLRVPADADPAKGPVRLLDIDETRGWLGNNYTKDIAPYAMYMGDKSQTSFLPNEEVAKKWKETGPGLPTSTMIPTNTCGWCGNPIDEPKASGGNPPPPPTYADGGSVPADASTSTPPTPAPDASSSTPPPPRYDAAPSAPDPGGSSPPVTPPARRTTGGCSVASAPANAWCVVLLVLVAIARRRRR
jgi:MYXO-CTERM domain-containing protein